MSKIIDERIVEMRFDNRQFESGVSSTLGTLERLKKGLNLEGAVKGLDDIDNAAKRIDMTGLSSAVDTVRFRFSALEVLAVTALANITNSVINTGRQLVNSLVIRPVVEGFNEYELKMGAIQTIMMSTGATLDEVNGYLRDLNTYSDKTIYSFRDMTSNIGKFTNAGVNLKDAVAAIQGISNVAAVSGANTNEASRAMYNFSQALSAGHVKLVDWKSIENANMATVEFKTQLLESALAVGTLTKTADGMYKTLDGHVIDATHGFNESLQDQWLTTEALVRTLNDYADETTEIGKKAFAAAQEVKTFSQLMDTLKEAVGSGWANTWEILFGNFEESKKLWTELGNVIGGFINRQSDARNEILKTWKDLGGRTDVIESAKNVLEGLLSVLKPISEAFREVFAPITGDQLFKMTKGIRSFTENLKISGNTAVNLKATFKGLFSIINIIKNVFSGLLKVVPPLAKGIGLVANVFLSFTGIIGNVISALDNLIESSGIFQGISITIELIVNSLTSLKNMISNGLDLVGFGLLNSVLEQSKDRVDQVGKGVDGLKRIVINAFKAMGQAVKNSSFVKGLTVLWNTIKSISKGIADAFIKLNQEIVTSISKNNFDGIIDLLNGISLGAITLGITKFVKNFSGALDDIGDIKNSLTNILDSVRGCFEAYQTQLKAGTLIKIATAIGILSAALVTLSLVDSEKLNVALGAITVLFADLLTSMTVFSKISGNTVGVVKSITAIIGISTSVLILANALKKIADLDIGQLTKGIVGVAGLTTIMITASKSMSNSGGTIAKGATQMVVLATAIKLLASACKDLSGLDWGQLTKGLVGVGVLLAEVSIFTQNSKFSVNSVATATGIVILSGAIKILASSCKDFGEMNWSEITKGLTSIGVLLGELALFTNLTGNSKQVILTSVGLIAIAGAMKILASAMSDFSNMQWSEIGRGLFSMAGALTIIAVALKAMPKNMLFVAWGLADISFSLRRIADTVGNLGGLSWGEITRGLTSMAGAMAILVIGLNSMSDAAVGTITLLAAAFALERLVPVVSAFGEMSWSSIAKGLVVLAGAFTILGVAGAVLTPLVPTMLALSGALAVMGVGIAGIGAGLTLAGTGLASLAVGITALATTTVTTAASIVASLGVIVIGVAKLIPAIAAKMGEAFVVFIETIANSIGAIGGAIKTIVLKIVDVLVECIPVMVDGTLKVISAVLDSLATHAPSIIDSILKFIIAVLEGVANNMPRLIQAAVTVLAAFFSGVIDALNGIDTSTLVKTIAGIGLLSAIMIALGTVASLIPGAMVGVLGIGVVIAELALVLAAIGALAQIPGLNWFINEGGELLQGIGSAIGKFIGGIVGSFMSGVSSQFPQIGTDLSRFMDNVKPFLEGASSINPSMMDGVKALAETILILTATNILDRLTSWAIGGNTLSRFAEELVPFGKAMKQFSDVISGIDSNTISNASVAGKALTEMANTIPNTGGVIGFFTGNNDMSSFGKQLVPFGQAMKQYGDSIAGLDVGSIQNSTTAGLALVELSNTLPNTGGVISWFTGESNLSKFGEQLVPFGQAMKNYSLSISGIDATVVTNSTNAAKALVELSNNLPSSGGIMSWFTGSSDMASFGQQLVTFGKSFVSYYQSVSGVDTSKLTSVTEEFRKLSELAQGMSNLDTSGMSTFAQNLTNLGNAGVNGFINAFTNATSKVSEAANSMITTLVNTVTSRQNMLTVAFTNMINLVIQTLNSQATQFTTAGTTIITNFVNGVKTNDFNVKNTFNTIIHACFTAIRNRYIDFYNAGKYLVEGFAGGINENTWYAEAKSRAMARAAANAARSELDIHSPSRVGYEIGAFFGMGFVNSLIDYIDKSREAGSLIGESARDGLRNAISKISDFIEDGINSQPTIRPILDLSQVTNGASKLSAILSRRQAVKISTDITRKNIESNQNGLPSSTNSTHYNFTQNNYSPKALSRIEIYRQTKNQFSALEGLV